MEYCSYSPEDTLEFAKRFAESLKLGDVVVLEGDLGAGKTVFAKGVGAALGVVELITSPTFVIVKEYQGRVKLNHIDLYRLDSEGASALGISELFEDAVTLVEWASNAPEILPCKVIKVDIAKTSYDAERIIKVTVGER